MTKKFWHGSNINGMCTNKELFQKKGIVSFLEWLVCWEILGDLPFRICSTGRLAWLFIYYLIHKTPFPRFVLQYTISSFCSLFSYEATAEMIHHCTFCCDGLNFGENCAAVFTLQLISWKGIPLHFSTLCCFNRA